MTEGAGPASSEFRCFFVPQPPAKSFDSGMARTVDWYLDNLAWTGAVLDGSYRLQRLGGQGNSG